MADYISQLKLPNNTTYDIRDKNLKLYTGSCATAAATAIKDVTTDGAFSLAKGAVVFVTFTNTNTAAVTDLKLRVNSNVASDAKPIKHEYNASEANLPGVGYLRANQTYQFYYDGTNWVTDVGRDANSTYSYMRPYENTGKGNYSTQGENPVKTAAAGWKFSLDAGQYFMYTHYYNNTAKSAITLNIGSTGAKPIYINGNPSSVSNYTLPGGQYLVYYDGTNYYFRTDNKMTGNITGDAATVNGHTVKKDVPSDAKFTDTNQYHKTGSWSGLTYTATAVNSADELKFTIPDNYGDTKNPYGTKAKNLVLAGPSSGSNAAPSFRALVAADIPTLAYVPATSGVNDVNTLVNTGIYNITSGSATNAPKGYGYGQLLVMSYRKHTGNTTTDWASQLYLQNGGDTASGGTTAPGNVLYYRTSSSNTWFDWQKAVHVAAAYTQVGDTNKPVYIAKDGTATAISYTIEKSVPSNAVFTDTNKYHKTGSWNGLTYTATAVNSADELKFTIPNKIQTNWELNATSGNSPALLFTRDGSLTDWKIIVTSGKLSFQSATDASNWTERAYFKDNTGDFVATSFTGKGSALTDLNGSNISSGTVAAARIDSAIARLASPDFTGTPTAPTAANGTNTTQIATTAFVNNTLAYVNAMQFKGTLGTGGTITALPATHNAGDTYRVITAGTWAGKYCEVGTLIICIKDGTAASDSDWTSVETNEDGAVISSSTSSTSNAIVRWDETSGRIIKNNSYVTLDDNGSMTFTHKAKGSAEVRITYGDDINYWWGVGNGNINHGLYDAKADAGTGKWILNAGADNLWNFNGNAINAQTVGTDYWIEYPEGGTLHSSGTITGALLIILPQANKTNTMISFDVNIFEYTEGYTRTTYNISGYTNGSNGWNNGSFKVYSNGIGAKNRLQVQCGTTNGKPYVLIGNTDTNWSYPQIAISNIHTGHQKATNNYWATGWELSFIQDTSNLTLLKTLTDINTQDINITGNANTATHADDATYIQGIDQDLQGINIAETITSPQNGKIRYDYRIGKSAIGLFPHAASTDTNAILTLSAAASSNYIHQLGFSTNSFLYHRAFIGKAQTNDTVWKRIAYTDSDITGNAATATSSKVLANQKGTYGTAVSTDTTTDRVVDANIAHVNNGGVVHFKIVSAANGPFTTSSDNTGHMLHFHWDAAAWDSQLFIPHNSVRSMAYRASLSAGTWGEWKTLLDTENTTIPPTVPTLSWGAEATILTINGSAVKIKAMPKPTYNWGDIGDKPIDANGKWSININGKADTAGAADTATTATNLSTKPSFAVSNTNNITLTIGDKTSDAFTVPYATKAGSLAAAKTLWGNSFDGSANIDGTITLASEKDIVFCENRKEDSSEGWAHNFIRWVGLDNEEFMHISVYGTHNALTYLYIGNNSHTGNNLRIAADGSINIPVNTASTSISTGAIVTGGGIGVGGQVTATRLAANGSNTSYNLYVNGNALFDIGTSDSVTDKRFLIKGNNKALSFGGGGIYAYTVNNDTYSNGQLNLQYFGGNIQIGNNGTNQSVTGNVYGNFTYHNSIIFNNKTGIKHIEFTRQKSNNGPSYICYPESGELAIGYAIGYDNSLAVFDGNTAIRPGKSNTFDLGTSSYKWANVYATTLAGSVKLVSGNTTITNTANERVSWYEDTVLTGYITIAKRSSNRANMGIHALGNIYIRPGNSSNQLASSGGVVVSHDTLYSGTNEALDLGTSSYQWKDTYSKSFIVDKNITLQYNSTDDSLDFIFA